MNKVVVVIPNWNGVDGLRRCLDSVVAQTLEPHIIVVDNGSVDESVPVIEKEYPMVELIKHDHNKGYAGGVNPGFKRAIEMKAEYVAPFNNDAVADKNWLKELKAYLDTHDQVGIATCKVLTADGEQMDSTGDWYTVWGLPYPRGRHESDINKYDNDTTVFGASGAASMYRIKMLEEVGLLDEDFFAYYEDVDLSFRAQLAGWTVAFVPSSIVYHEISTTSNKIKGFATYQTIKNQPLLFYKNVPKRFMWRVGWRFTIAHTLFFLRAITRGQGWTALKADVKGTGLLFKARGKRRRIQASKKVSDEYIWGIMKHDLPPNAKALRSLRAKWWAMTGKRIA